MRFKPYHPIILEVLLQVVVQSDKDNNDAKDTGNKVYVITTSCLRWRRQCVSKSDIQGLSV